MIPRHPTAVAIVARVAAIYGVPADLLWRRHKHPTLAEARHLSWWKIAKDTGWNPGEVGVAVGIDRTSVLHGLGKIRGLLEGNTGTGLLRNAVQLLRVPWIGDWKRVDDEIGKQWADQGQTSGIAGGAPPGSPSISSPDQGSSVLVLKAFQPTSSEPKKPESKRARRPRKPEVETEAPDHLAPTARQVEIANQKNIDLPVEIERYLNHYRSRGQKRMRWCAGLTEWLLSPYPKALKGQGLGPAKGGNAEAMRQRALRLADEEKKNAAQ